MAYSEREREFTFAKNLKLISDVFGSKERQLKPCIDADFDYFKRSL